MSLIRIGNINYGSARPYKALDDVEGFVYEENHATENARKLHEGELDVALIPVGAFAIHGAYVGLDFGIAVDGASHLLRLFSHSPVEQLETVYAYEDSSASILLLQLLARNFWRVSFRIVPRSRVLSPHELGPREGLMLRSGLYRPEHLTFQYQVDLLEKWVEMTRVPFVFLVWATRPGVLSGEQHQRLHELLFRAVKPYQHREAPGLEPTVLPGKREVILYFGEHELAALELLFQEAYLEHLLPEMNYQPLRLSLLDRRPRFRVEQRPIEHILASAAEGDRLTVRDGIRLAHEVEIADLGVACEARFAEGSAAKTLVQVFAAETDWLFRPQKVFQQVEKAAAAGIRHVYLPAPAGGEGELSRIEMVLASLKASFPITIEAFNASHIAQLGKAGGITLSETISRLITAGLDELPSDGGGMLIERVRKLRGSEQQDSSLWLQVMKWVHRFGARSSCSLEVGEEESWEERLLHLHKLRLLQDVNPGFRYLVVRPFSNLSSSGIREIIRAVLISRLFLDNVSALEVRGVGRESYVEITELSFGANRLRIESQMNTSTESLEALNALRHFGFEFELEPSQGTVEEVH
ncbi:MAG: hypothetical protein KDD64_11205 [Bdellovibrionales bacterium]|nr:hypothetical protein [Bdellovibrionales bacterium]